MSCLNHIPRDCPNFLGFPIFQMDIKRPTIVCNRARLEIAPPHIQVIFKHLRKGNRSSSASPLRFGRVFPAGNESCAFFSLSSSHSEGQIRKSPDGDSLGNTVDSSGEEIRLCTRGSDIQTKALWTFGVCIAVVASLRSGLKTLKGLFREV